MESIKLKFEGREGFINITEQVQDYVTRHNIKDGMVMIATPELNCALTMADQDNKKMETEFLTRIEKIIPQFDGMKFAGWAIPGLKASLVGQTLSVMVGGGCLLMGIHQGIFAVDFTGYAADFSSLDERFFFINHIGTELAEGEEPEMPAELKERNEAIAEEERKAGKKKKYETPAWMRKAIDEGKY